MNDDGLQPRQPGEHPYRAADADGKEQREGGVMKLSTIFLLASTSLALAADRTPWVEPPDLPISPTGTTIEVENYRCEVTSPRGITCMNVGRVCKAFRAAQEADTAKTFGCAIKGEPTYPCPPWEERMKKIEAESQASMMCMPMSYGMFSG